MPPRLPIPFIQSLQHELRRQAGAVSVAPITMGGVRHMASAQAATDSSSSRVLLNPQPLSHRKPEFRKSQLHRQYASILRTMPLMVLFQHNNLQSVEWVNIRRELNKALRKVDETNAAAGRPEPPIADSIKLQIVQTHIFEAALRVVEHFRPDTSNSGVVEDTKPITSRDDPRLTHDLSRTAYQAVLDKRGKHDFSTLLMGPIAILSFPTLSSDHLKAALSILAPKAPEFPAPTRRANPGYHDLTTQAGLQKLMFLGARVEGKLFDDEQTRWVGGIQGGMGGLQAQIVALLQSVGAGVTGALEGGSKSLYLTLESRRSVLEEEEKGDEQKGEPTEEKKES